MDKPVDGAEALVDATQADIDAAKALCGIPSDPDAVKADRAVQAFSRARLAGVKEGLEMAAKVAEDWDGAFYERDNASFYIATAIRAIPVKADDRERA